MDLKEIISDVGEKIDENASPIFIGLGLAAFGLAVVTACIEAPKAKKVIDQTKEDLVEVVEAYEEERINDDEFKEAKKELYFGCGKEIARRYAPILLLTASGTFCILNAHNIDTNKITGLTTAYQISETTRKMYQEKVIEQFGEKKEQKVRDAVNQEKAKRVKKNDAKVVTLETTKPASLCFDPYTGRYFRCSVDRIESAINSLNEMMLHNHTQTASLNDFYDLVGLDRVKDGDMRGWDIEQGCVEFRPTYGGTSDNEPCLIIDFDRMPEFAV